MASSQYFRRILQWVCVFIALSSQVLVSAEFQKSKKIVPYRKELTVKRSDFPSDFVFGVSTSSFQTEGSSTLGGKGPSIWDNFVDKYPEKIDDHSNIVTAVDSYNRYKEEVKLVKDLGADFYRISISWTRILPNGTLSGGVNQEGIDHYNSLIDEIAKNGITPFVTLLHFDSPQALQDKYGGLLNRSFVKDFKDYSEVCFKAFGDRVKFWTTINEPWIVALLGYDLGIHAPGRCSVPSSPTSKCTDGNSATEPYIVSHNILLAHASAVKIYREKYQRKQGGQIGICLVAQYVEPYSDSVEDIAASKRIMDFNLGWYMEPLVYGHYPSSMSNLVKERLPVFTKAESEMVKGSFDFIGVNYYSSRYGKNDPESASKPKAYRNDYLAASSKQNINGDLIGPEADGNPTICVSPQGLEKVLVFMKEHYQNPKIYITENGVTEARNDTRGLKESLNDRHRIEFILRHLYWINSAIRNGVNVKGYIHWSLLDNFELAKGYTVRFGLYYVDYKDNLKRIPKLSAKWLPKFLKG